MKKTILMAVAVFLFAGITSAQKVEVLYFKANLACCHARACNNLENQVKQVVESNYENGDVVFKSVRLSDANNAELVQKYNANSQTVVIVSNKKRKQEIVDASEMVRNLRRTRNQADFEKDFTEAINKLL